VRIAANGADDDGAPQRAVQLLDVELDFRARDEADRRPALDLPERVEEVEPLVEVGRSRARSLSAAFPLAARNRQEGRPGDLAHRDSPHVGGDAVRARAGVEADAAHG
jgi:hypothetical protein